MILTREYSMIARKVYLVVDNLILTMFYPIKIDIIPFKGLFNNDMTVRKNLL